MTYPPTDVTTTLRGFRTNSDPDYLSFEVTVTSVNMSTASIQVHLYTGCRFFNLQLDVIALSS